MKSSLLQPFLIAVAVLSAFTLPPAKSGVRDQVALLFAPVSVPARATGKWLRDRLLPEHAQDVLSPAEARSPEQLKLQNAVLITQIARLEAQLEDLRRLSAEYAQLGDLRDMVQPAAVIAGPDGNRQTLSISTAGLNNVREKMAVVHARGFAGQISSVATLGGAARVLLVTDPESRIQARFARFTARADGGITTTLLPTDPCVITGKASTSGTMMIADMLPAAAIRNVVRVGDVVLLDETKLSAALKGLRIGTVKSINLPPTNATHASIDIEPTADFRSMREVLVVTK